MISVLTFLIMVEFYVNSDCYIRIMCAGLYVTYLRAERLQVFSLFKENHKANWTIIEE